jgi:hypothetical protein
MIVASIKFEVGPETASSNHLMHPVLAHAHDAALPPPA